jgi:hypothetical protein
MVDSHAKGSQIHDSTAIWSFDVNGLLHPADLQLERREAVDDGVLAVPLPDDIRDLADVPPQLPELAEDR